MISHTSSYFKFHLNRGAESVFYGKDICRSENDLKYSFAFSRGGERNKISMFSLRTSSSTFPVAVAFPLVFTRGCSGSCYGYYVGSRSTSLCHRTAEEQIFRLQSLIFDLCASFLPSVLHFYVSSPVPIIKSTFYVQLGPS